MKASNKIIFFLFLISSKTLFAQEQSGDKIRAYILKNKDNSAPSISKGSVSSGSLENGKLFPFSGSNFQYFDTTSYINERAYLNDKIRTAVLNSYKELERIEPGRKFCIIGMQQQKGWQDFSSPHSPKWPQH